MAVKRKQSTRSNISRSTRSYMGNSASRSFTGNKSQFMNHNQKYREVRNGFGMSAG